MKRALCFLSLFLLLSSLLSLPVAAQSTEEYFSDFFDALPPQIRDVLEEKGEADAAGELFGVESLLSLVLSLFSDGVREAAPSLVRLLSLSLLFALLAHLARELSSAAAPAAEAALSVLFAFFLFRIAEGDISHTAAALSDLSRLSFGLVPIFFGLFAAGGSTATATAAASAFTAFTYLIEGVCMAVLLPLLRLLFAFTAIRAAGGRLKTDGLFSTLRGSYVTALSFLSLLLVTSLGFQSSLATSADSLAAGAVRFTVGQLVPVVGSALAGSLRTVAASLSVLRGTLGALSVFALLLLLLPPLVEVLLFRLVLSLAASLSGALGSESARETALSFRTVYDLAAATLAICLVIFILLISLVLRCGFAISTA